MDFVEQVSRQDEREVIRIIGTAEDKEELRKWSNETDLHGKPCLNLAKSARLAKYVLDADANPNGQDTHGVTALHVACERGNLALVELLLGCKAELHMENDSGETPLIYAVANERIELLPLLLGKTKTIPLRAGLVAQQRGYDDIVALLLEAKAEIKPDIPAPKLKEYEGSRGLIEAARAGDTARVDSLLDAESNLPTDGYCGNIPLTEAAANGHVDTVHLLLEAKANVNQGDLLGETALFKAVLGNHGKVASLLLEWKANVHETNMAMQTPLSVAESWGFEWPKQSIGVSQLV
eukprot:GEMP01050353.1.p1 GENE.GEMP01050353.1~~GEMP01050353.1.p1  ORF type:complete len:294 (+),score=72.08 GEMP01050353.1:54-935(+)